MERYFLGNNTGYGFRSFYDEQLSRKKQVILLKGGPGTGKSSLLGKLAECSKARGMDWEEWYCSGDPTSLDGVYIKDLDTAVVDATAPHATGADLPVLRDIIFDLASGLDKSMLDANLQIIKEILNDKKRHFNRAYQHLKCALCHYNNIIECESATLDLLSLHRYAQSFAKEIGLATSADCNIRYIRKLFTHAICPSGESAYYDSLRNKRLYKLKGGDLATAEFLRRVCECVDSATLFLNPLEPSHAEGIVAGNIAIVRDVGQFADNVSEEVNLNIFCARADADAIEEERNARVLSEAFAVEQLNKGRASHLEVERYFIAAMDFERINAIRAQIEDIIFANC